MEQPATDYQTEQEYTEQYFECISPAQLNFQMISKGYRPVDTKKTFHYLELGCGFGLSTIVHAALYPHAHFYGCDMNVSQIESAQRKADKMGLTNITFYPCTFLELLTQESLPSMDFITAHGIYSWVNADVQQQICNLTQQLLRPQGVCYLSYNTSPKRQKSLPLYDFLQNHIQAHLGSLQYKVEGGLKAFDRFQSGLPGLQSPDMKNLCSSGQKKLDYAIGELANACWDNIYLGELVENLQAADIAYIGDMNSTLHQKKSAGLEKTLQRMPNQASRTGFDILIKSSPFAQSIFCKSPQKLSQQERDERLDNLWLRAGVLKKTLALPTLEHRVLSHLMYQELKRQRLYQPQSFKALQDKLAPKEEDRAAIREALLQWIPQVLSLCFPPDEQNLSQQKIVQYNAILRGALTEDDIPFIHQQSASALNINKLGMQFFLDYSQGINSKEALYQKRLATLKTTPRATTSCL